MTTSRHHLLSSFPTNARAHSKNRSRSRQHRANSSSSKRKATPHRTSDFPRRSDPIRSLPPPIQPWGTPRHGTEFERKKTPPAPSPSPHQSKTTTSNPNNPTASRDPPTQHDSKKKKLLPPHPTSPTRLGGTYLAKLARGT
ncbi:hypothetical protein P280DRAFT_229060 [Massarina eburnea CBS 473.64]|uniref:Uncharacterized protein n=1 Tax=Massarina eburnea CBS 473.64 TaxID=1395130 RepID=A0A6A6SAL8_9PLEO|nr:hypothetical protein P280DRAFT_229060 [Massarina eburnea CBS 473.64]